MAGSYADPGSLHCGNGHILSAAWKEMHCTLSRKICQRLPRFRLDWHCHKMPCHIRKIRRIRPDICGYTPPPQDCDSVIPCATCLGGLGLGLGHAACLENELHFILGIFASLPVTFWGILKPKPKRTSDGFPRRNVLLFASSFLVSQKLRALAGALCKKFNQNCCHLV